MDLRSADPAINVGATLEKIGRYELVSELGRGSMGRVYLAKDPNIGRHVALKVLSPAVAVEPAVYQELGQRFVLEARAAGRLNHPGIVTIYDAATEPGGYSYIAMEWVDGTPLDSLVRERRRLPAAASATWVAQVARALDYAHRHGVVHRDVKPANVLVGQDGKVKILDFGIAKLPAETLTLAGQVLGTPAFMSPEQVRNGPVDGRSDLFSLGCVLYYCVTGKTPFPGDSIASIAHRIVNTDPDPIDQAELEVPEELLAVIERSLCKEAADRFQTGEELAEALEPCAEPSPAGAPSHSTSRLTGRQVSGPFASMPGAAELPEATVVATDVLAAGPDRSRGRGYSFPRLATWAASCVLLLGLVVAAVELRQRSPGSAPSALPVAEPVGSTQQPAELPAPLGIEESADLAAVSAPDVSSLELPEPEGQPALEGDGSVPSQEGAAPGRRDEDTARSTPTRAAAGATLELIHRSRLGIASIAVWIDGRKAWAEEVNPPDKTLQRLNPVRRLKGQEVRATIPVAAGKHRIRVRVSSTSKSVDAEGFIEAVLPAGETRRLRVLLDRSENELELRWVE